MWKIQIWLVSLFLVFSCTGLQKRHSNDFSITGTLSNADSIMLYVEELISNEVIPIDSIYTDQYGNFSYQHTIEDAGFYILRIDQKNSITLLIEPGEEISITGDALDLVYSYDLIGSVGSQLLARLSKKQREGQSRVDSLGKEFRKHKYDENFMEIRQDINNRYSEIVEDQQKYVMQFIKDNPNSLASIIALYQYFGKKMLLNVTEHSSYFEDLSIALSEAYPYNKHVMDLKRRMGEYRKNEAQRLEAEKTLAPGAPAPEILLPDAEGNQVALSSLKGKIVLIDFWAAWCPPCRESNRRLKRIYEEYKPLGFEIYAVSLDRTLDQWVLGVKEDGIDWIQVSDLRFWSSPVVSLYNVTSIPHNVLVDKEGKIIDKGIMPGELKAILNVMLK